MVTGHPAALARLHADGLITDRQPASGGHQITDAGRAAYEQWKADYGPPASPSRTCEDRTTSRSKSEERLR